MAQVKFNLFQYSPSDTEIPSKLISAHTFAYISLDAMIPQPEADKTHIAYGFPVPKTGDLSHVVTFSDHVHTGNPYSVCLISFLWYHGVERNISKCMG